jgi:hypothetical protein
MQHKRPKNQKGQRHGYWEAKWLAGGWYKGHYLNDTERGYFVIDWKGNGNIDKHYYAR